MTYVETPDFVTITLRKPVVLDVANAITEKHAPIRAIALTGYWHRDVTKSSDAPPIGFSIYRAYHSDDSRIPVEVGERISVDSFGPDSMKFSNRKPAFIVIDPKDVLATVEFTDAAATGGNA